MKQLFLTVAGITLVSLIGYIGIKAFFWFHDPQWMRYSLYFDKRDYYIALPGRGLALFEAEYYAVTFANPIRGSKLPTNLSIIVYLDDKEILLSDITKDLLKGNQGIPISERNSEEIWSIRGENAALRVTFFEGNVRALIISDSLFERDISYDEIKISWEGGPPFSPPLIEEEVSTLFGNPDRTRTYRSFGP